MAASSFVRQREIERVLEDTPN